LVVAGHTFPHKASLTRLGGYFSPSLGWLLPPDAAARLREFTSSTAPTASLDTYTAPSKPLGASAVVASASGAVPINIPAVLGASPAVSGSSAASSIVGVPAASDASTSDSTDLYMIPRCDPAPLVLVGDQHMWRRLEIPDVQTTFARFLLWHGRLPGWPALRMVCKPWKRRSDVTWKSDRSNASTRSILNTVMQAINKHVGIGPHSDPTELQIASASSYISQLERTEGTSFTAMYNVLKKARPTHSSTREDAASGELDTDSDHSDAEGSSSGPADNAT